MNSQTFIDIFKSEIIPLSTDVYYKYYKYALVTLIPLLLVIGIYLTIIVFKEDGNVLYTTKYKHFMYGVLVFQIFLYLYSLFLPVMFVQIGHLLVLLGFSSLTVLHLAQRYKEVFFVEW